MPASVTPAPFPEFMVAAVILAALFVGLALRGTTRARRRVVGLAMGVVCGVAAMGFGVASYQEYQWTYAYSVEVQPTGTASVALVLPIPGDASLLNGLRTERGHVNWTIVDTEHGRGLYARFDGPAAIGVTLSELAPGGSTHNTTLTLANSSLGGAGGNWILLDGNGTSVTFGVSEAWAATGTCLAGGLRNESLLPGWHAYQLGLGFIP